MRNHQAARQKEEAIRQKAAALFVQEQKTHPFTPTLVAMPQSSLLRARHASRDRHGHASSAAAAAAPGRSWKPKIGSAGTHPRSFSSDSATSSLPPPLLLLLPSYANRAAQPLTAAAFGPQNFALASAAATNAPPPSPPPPPKPPPSRGRRLRRSHGEVGGRARAAAAAAAAAHGAKAVPTAASRPRSTAAERAHRGSRRGRSRRGRGSRRQGPVGPRRSRGGALPEPQPQPAGRVVGQRARGACVLASPRQLRSGGCSGRSKTAEAAQAIETRNH